MKGHKTAIFIAAVAGLALAGCSPGSSTKSGAAGATSATGAAAQSGAKAVAVIQPASGSQVHGTVSFVPVADGVRITADLSGLTPGRHGFHIHSNGNCGAHDASSAGGHYNPEGNPHGAPDDAKHHAGDLGNISAGRNGQAHAVMTVDYISVNGTHNPVLGRAVIIHAQADDLTSQPSGAAGARVGCGVIHLTNL